MAIFFKYRDGHSTAEEVIMVTKMLKPAHDIDWPTCPGGLTKVGLHESINAPEGKGVSGVRTGAAITRAGAELALKISWYESTCRVWRST